MRGSSLIPLVSRVAPLGFALLAACQFYDPSLLEVNAGAVCELRRPPPRPSEGSLGGDQELFFGLREVVLNQPRNRWRDIGYDLDGFCTEPPDFERECDPPSGAEPRRDGNDGIDNRFGADLFPLVNAAVPGIEEQARAGQSRGRLPLLRLRGWNGEDDDPRVDVAILQTLYGVPAADDDEPVPHVVGEDFFPRDPDSNERVDPRWDGTDFLFPRSDNFVDGDLDLPLVASDNAYVANRVVVANLPERVEIVFPASEIGVVVRLTGAVATGRLSDDLSTLEDVTIAGRWSIVDLLRTAENIGLCAGTAEYNILVDQLDTFADVRSVVGGGSGPGIECNAISLGVAFTGSRVRFGGLREGPDLINLCE